MPAETPALGTPWEAGAPLRRLAVGLTALVAAGLLLLWGATWRKDRAGLARLDALTAAGTRPVLAFWHETYPPLFVMARGRRVVVISGTSFRGAVIAEVGRLFGHRAIQIAPGHGDVLAQIIAIARALPDHPLAFAVDGPLGPRRQAKSGAVRIARQLGAPLLPVTITARPAPRLVRRWDKMAFPLPLARVRLISAPPLSPDATPEALTEALNALDR